MNINNISKRNRVYQSVQSALQGFRTFSKLFYSRRVGTTFINEWNGVHVVVKFCLGKSSSYIPTSKMLGFAVMGKYQWKLIMLFNLAFQMKCKYIKMKWSFSVIYVDALH